MSEESKGMNPRTWTAISVGVLLIAVAVGIILYVVTGDLLNTFATILLVYGVYMAAMGFVKKGGENNFGPSESDAALAAGAVIAGIGAEKKQHAGIQKLHAGPEKSGTVFRLLSGKSAGPEHVRSSRMPKLHEHAHDDLTAYVVRPAGKILSESGIGPEHERTRRQRAAVLEREPACGPLFHRQRAGRGKKAAVRR